ncbi:Glycyl-glycine endopeptidase ALE-1 precursor [Salinivirga cyanobacteriivorans]|uniref:Glycyl-glycine endopeptidase ALE-1 n=1 Tax=Salinivirga cyanobacteriivorans TaxID=1307839 RepID=A0A0S2I2R5_9BACT|nr:M23 family metallopeptidase [Salinivirga cyanobacteriivorans]ALO16535.1 Glycyl-glycine endopeptidase ALE-1 precursor [Salinivirga cyanobacteriivorans]
MSSNTRYYLDPHTLTYKPVKKNRKLFYRTTLWVSSVIFVLSISAFIFLNSYRLTPHEWILSKQNERLAEEIIQKKDAIIALRDTLVDIEENDDIIYRPFAEIKPIPKDIREAGFGGVDRYREFAGMEYADDLSSVFREFDKLKKQIEIQKKSFNEVESLVQYIDEFYAAKPAIRPISQKDEIYISSHYGMRLHPIYKRWKMHHGIDYAAQIGSPVYSTGKGIVKAAYYASGYGKVVKVDHGFGYLSIYAHLDKYIVKKGDTISRGQLVGYVGNTGSSTGPHLHYEIRKNNQTQNPLYFYMDDLEPYEYDRIVSK